MSRLLTEASSTQRELWALKTGMKFQIWVYLKTVSSFQTESCEIECEYMEMKGQVVATVRVNSTSAFSEMDPLWQQRLKAGTYNNNLRYAWRRLWDLFFFFFFAICGSTSASADARQKEIICYLKFLNKASPFEH